MDKVDDEMMPGFRFHPTDEEIVDFYLKRKIQQRSLPIELIKQVDIYKYEPWDLPSKKSYDSIFSGSLFLFSYALLSCNQFSSFIYVPDLNEKANQTHFYISFLVSIKSSKLQHLFLVINFFC